MNVSERKRERKNERRNERKREREREREDGGRNEGMRQKERKQTNKPTKKQMSLKKLVQEKKIRPTLVLASITAPVSRSRAAMPLRPHFAATCNGVIEFCTYRDISPVVVHSSV